MPGNRASATGHAGEDAALEVLAEAATAEQATHRLLQLLSELFDARFAVLWTLDDSAMLLRWTEHWSPDPGVQDFADSCQRLSFPRGAGLPGRVWQNGEPLWIANVSSDETPFARSQAAVEAGLNSVVAVPIYGRTKFLGVMELFSAKARSEDRPTLSFLRTIGRLLGEYLERRAAEERLAASESLRAAMISAALDCIITIDHHSRVIDFNPAAERTFGYDREHAIGADLAELVIPPRYRSDHFAAVGRLVAGGRPRLLDRRTELQAMRADGTEFPVELTITRIDTPGDPLFVGFLRDITERRQSQDELTRLLEREHDARVRAEQAEQRARRIAKTLQRSLLPPMLPDIPGIDLAAGFHAGGHETEVGGDFYDIFELRPGRWAWVIGDVCGKGAEAASMTALARHTIRAAATHERSPEGVLRALNVALLREQPLSGFLTAAYGELDLTSSPAELTIAMGGHPPLMIVRRDGEIETVGPSGTLLGAIAEPRLADTRTSLGPGDMLVAYTDGVIEARTANGRLELEGLIEVLEGCRGQRAAAVGRAIERAAATGERRPTDDDVAFLIMRLLDEPAAA